MSDVSEAGAAFLAATEESAGSPGGLVAPTDEQEPGGGEEARTAPPAPDSANDTEVTTTTAEEDRGPVPWGEHKKAKDEAQRYREQLRAYEEALPGVHPADAAALVKASLYAAQMQRAGKADEVQALLSEVAEAFGIEAAEAVAEEAGLTGDDPAEQVLTKADLEKFYAEKAEEEQYERQVSTLQAELLAQGRELGYKPDGDEKEQARWARVLGLAVSLYDGDVAAAHEQLEADKQAAIDAYLASKKGDADVIPRTADGAAPAAASGEGPKDFDEARRALEASLASGT